MIGAKWYDMVVGVDIHWVLVPVPPAPPIPTPLPHPFTGLVFDPIGMAVGAAVSAGISAATGGGFAGPVFINSMPAANTGTDATNKLVMPHFPMPPGVMWAPVPAGLKPPIPGKKPDPGIPSPIPTNDATLITGSKTVYIGGTNACRLGDLAMSCGEPVRLPSSTVIAIPMGPPVLIGGPPALDFIAMATSAIRSQWVSGKLHGVLKAKPGSWKSKIICFVTGHPVDVMSGMVLTEALDYEIPGPIPFAFERTYYSRSDYNGPLGIGWTHAYDCFMRQDQDHMTLHWRDGRDLYFYDVRPDRVCRNPVERMDLSFGDGQIRVDTGEKLRYIFAPQNRADNTWPLVAIEDLAGNKIELSYDAQGFLIGIIDSGGRQIRLVNDQQGRLMALHLPDPEREKKQFRAMTYEYDDQGDLVAAGDALGRKQRYHYKYHLLVQEVDRNGLSFYFAYDGIDHDAWCVRTWGDGGIYDHVLTYDKQQHVTVVENSLGHSTAYMGNPSGLVEKVVDALGGETLYEWDAYWRKTAETDGNGHTTRWEFDERGNLLREIRPDGGEVAATYDRSDNRITETGPDGKSWRWVYDQAGRIVSQESPEGDVYTYAYARYGLAQMIDPAGFTTVARYDEAGNLIEIENDSGLVSRWQYDHLGRAPRVEDGVGNTQTRRFDLLGSVVEMVAPDGNRSRCDYDAEGNLVGLQDSYHQIRLRYEGFHNLALREEGDARHKFLYDSEERLLGIADEAGREYRFELNEVGEVVKEIGFDGVTLEYERDKAGQVTKLRRPGRVTAYEYDAMGRIVAMDHEDGLTERFEYAIDGELIAAENNDIRLGFEHDALGRLTRESAGDHFIENSYDHNDAISAQRSSFGLNVFMERTGMGDVTAVRAESPGYVGETRFTRNPNGFAIQRAQGAMKSRFERDALDRVTRHHVTAGNQTLHLEQFQWNAAYRLAERRQGDGEITQYLHDPTGNLVRSRNSRETVWRQPDAFGNIYDSPRQDTRRYGPAGQLLHMDQGDGSIEMAYDGEGNLIAKNTTDGLTWKYAWDGAGRLRKLTRPDGMVITYAYDPLGRRISRTIGSQTTRWFWHGDTPIHQWQGDDPEPNQVITWLHEPDTFTPLARICNGVRHEIVTDYLGNPLMALDSEGTPQWRGQLDILGRTTQAEGDDELCPFRFNGQHYDSESGLHYNRFRYFDPETGLYISQDPTGLAGGINVYAYVHDSLILVDPLGLDWNYQLRDAKGNVYYSGRASDKQTPKDVMRRHSKTKGSDGKRFRKGLDQFEQITPPGTSRNITRGIEELGVLDRGESALLGRKAKKVRGNKIHGVSLTSRNRGKYLGAARGFLTRKGAKGVDDLKVKVCK